MQNSMTMKMMSFRKYVKNVMNSKLVETKKNKYKAVMLILILLN